MTFYDPNMSLKKVFASVEEQSEQQAEKSQMKKLFKKYKLKKSSKVKAKMTKKQQKQQELITAKEIEIQNQQFIEWFKGNSKELENLYSTKE